MIIITIKFEGKKRKNNTNPKKNQKLPTFLKNKDTPSEKKKTKNKIYLINSNSNKRLRRNKK